MSQIKDLSLEKDGSNLNDFIHRVVRNKDYIGAIKVAENLNSDTKKFSYQELSINWLCNANEFLIKSSCEKDIGSLVDIDEFISSHKSISSTIVFKDHNKIILDALIKNPNIVTIYTGPGVIFTLEICKGIARFIKESKHIAHIDLSSAMYCNNKINANLLKPIAKALEINTSVKTIDLSFCEQITDEGLKYLMEVKEINLSGCYKTTDVGLKTLKSVIYKIL
jgi:hypothetical protein